MRIGMVGLGRMGANLTRRLLRHGHEVVAFDVDAEAAGRLAGDGAGAASSLDDLLGRLTTPRFASRGEADFANRVLSAMRRGFGGHAEDPGG